MSYRRKFFDLRSRSESNEILVSAYRTLIHYHPGLTPLFYDLCIINDTRAIVDMIEEGKSSFYDSPEAYFILSSISALCSKNADIRRGDLTCTPRESAILKFLDSEKRCLLTNERFRKSDFGEITNADGLLLSMQRKISQVLGDVPALSSLAPKFGPGSNVNVKKNTSARYKLNARITASRETLSAFWSLKIQDAYPHWLTGKPLIGAGELTTVPKTAEIDRCIIIEPLLNTFLQLGVGTHMKRRLLLAGCDLYDQSHNQNLARQGSIHNDVVTLDLSSASDLISYAVVLELLPIQWVEFLDALRTPIVSCKEFGKNFLFLEKFSSMGNGFTFELESLIFYAAAWAVYEEARIPFHNASIYGDDIIVDRRVSGRLVQLLENLGFSVNAKKSHFDGPFRESCGGDYLNGIDVRPFFVKDRFTSARIVAMMNHFLHCAFPSIGYRMFNVLFDFLPKHHRNYGPIGFGDGHIQIGQAPPVSRFSKNGFCGYKFVTFVQTPRRSEESLDLGDRLYPLYSQYLRECDESDKENTNRNNAARSQRGSKGLLEFSRRAGSSRSDDPYVLRGSDKERRIRVYTMDYDETPAYYSSTEKSIRRHNRRRVYLERKSVIGSR